MRLILPTVLLAFLFVSCAGKPTPFTTAASAATATIESRLPPGWHVVARRDATAPRGLINRTPGAYLALQGSAPTYWVTEERGIPVTRIYGTEQIELWITPPDYAPARPFFLRFFTPGTVPPYHANAARNRDILLFSDAIETPTWPNWGPDIYSALKLKPVPAARDLQHTPGN